MKYLLIAGFILGLCPGLADAGDSGSTGCVSQRFVIRNADQGEQEFDVKALREERPDLYRIISSNFFLESALGEAVNAAFRPMDYRAANVAANSDEKMNAFFRFLGSGAIEAATKKMLFACGSFADNLAAHLSIGLGRADGERIAELLTDPAIEKLAARMPFISKLKDPIELLPSSAAAAERARLDIIAACVEAGVTVSICQALKFQQPR